MLAAASTASTWHAGLAQTGNSTGSGHLVPLFPAAGDPLLQGFVRVINHSSRAGDVTIRAFDNEGVQYGPATLAMDADETVHFNSTDLEESSASKGLSNGVGSGSGDWRLTLESGLDIEVLSFIRTPMDGFLTAMHDLVPTAEDGSHRVAVFNPASNVDQVSRLRLINPGREAAQVTVAGIDGNGEPGSGEIQLTVPAGAARTLHAQEMESGGAGFEGALGNGAGKWQLQVTASRPIQVMSLLSSPTGHLTNLSTEPANVEGGVHTVPLFPAAADPLGRQGFVRVINHSNRSGTVTIDAFDDTDRDFASSTLALDSGETVHFNSDDLEMGNPDKGLTGGAGAGDGDWRLTLSSGLDIEVLAYIRTVNDGFLTAMHDRVPREGERYRVATFNPGANVKQASLLRLVNAGSDTADVTVKGIDDRGERSSGSASVPVPPGSSRTLTAQELEAGGNRFEGELGDGAGKWQLVVESEQPIAVMSLLSSPTGHLTNLSTAPALDYAPPSPAVFDDRAVGKRIVGDDPARFVDFLAGGRFREAEGAQVYEGGYTYTHTGSNRATVEFDYDDGRRCTYLLTFQSRTAGSLNFTCDDGSSGESSWRLEEMPSAGDGTDTYCRLGDVIAPGASCDIFETPFTFEVEAGGASCVLGQGFTSCSGNRQDFTNTTINGITFTFVAGRNQDDSWTIENVAPTPPGGIAQGPDLVVASVSTSDSTPATGASFMLTAVVRNSGTEASAATTLRFYRSSNVTVSTGDMAVGSRAVGRLSATGESEQSIDLTAPADPGTYHYGACVDTVAGESDRTDNCSAGVTVTVVRDGGAGAPDLVVESPSVSNTNPEAGGSFTLSAVVRNRGDARADATTLRYYRSNDVAISGSDTTVGSQSVAALASAASVDRSISLAAPMAAGSYYYGACVDGVTGETDTGNNCSGGVRITVAESAPVEGEDFELDRDNGASAGIAYANGRFYVADWIDDKVYAYRANGERDAASDFDLDTDNSRPERIAHGGSRFYVVDGSDDKVYTYATNGQRDPGADFDLAFDNRNPAGLAVVNGRIHVLDDSDNKVYVYGAEGQRVSTAEIGLVRDNRWPEGLAHHEGRFYVADRFDDKVFAYGSNGQRDTAAEFDLDGDNGSPTGMVAYNGRFYVLDDSDDRVYVYKPDGPDLAVDSPSVSDEAPGLGSAFTFSATVANRGMSRSAATTLRYYRSDNSTISATDTEVGSDAVAAIDVDGTESFAIGLTAPSHSGNHYYGACIDPVIDELDEDNNCSSAVLVSVPGPDLAVEAPEVSDQTPNASSSFTLSVTVRNLGDRPASASRLRYYRSTNSTISDSDNEVGTQALGALAAAGSTERTITLTAPSSTGTYYYGACVDLVPGEPDDSNNCTRFGVRVDVGDDGAEAFDLVGDNGQPKGIAHAGGRFHVVDAGDDKVYAYSSDGQRQPASDFDLVSANASATDLAYVDDRFHVVDIADDKVYTYRANGQRDPSSEFDFDVLNHNGVGIAHDGSGFFVLDWRDAKVYAYRDGGQREPASDFALHPLNESADGLAYVNDRFYVGDTDDDKVYAYWSNGRHDAASDFNLHADNGLVRGIANAGGMFYVLDETDEEVYSYAIPAEPAGFDLIVDSATASDHEPEAGASFDLGATVRNRGNSQSPGATLRYYRSTDALISADDTELKSEAVGNLAASASSARSASLTSPDEDGCYFCGACVDDAAGDTATANNCSRPVEILVGEPPDLDITRVRHNLFGIAFIGEPIELTVTVMNRGDGASGPAKLRFGNGTEAEIPPLAPGESATVDDHRVGSVQRGFFTFSVCASDVPCERRTANNCGSTSVEIR